MQNFKKPQSYFRDENKSGSWFERSRYEDLLRNDSLQNERSTAQRSSFGQSNNQPSILSSSYGPDSFFRNTNKFTSNDTDRGYNNNLNNDSSQTQFNDSYREVDDQKTANWCKYENSSNTTEEFNQPAYTTDSYQNRSQSRDYADDFVPSRQLDDDCLVPRGNDRFQSNGRFFNQSSTNRTGQRFPQLQEKFPQNSRYGSDSFNRPSSNQAAQNFRQTKSPQSSGANKMLNRRHSYGVRNQVSSRKGTTTVPPTDILVLQLNFFCHENIS